GGIRTNTEAHVRDDLSAYLDGELGGDARRTVEAHLVTCADCRRELAELRATVALVRRLPEAAPPRPLFVRAPEAAPPAGLLRWLGVLRLATGAVAILLATLVVGDILAPRPSLNALVLPSSQPQPSLATAAGDAA